MAVVLADQFANSASGYIAGIFLPFIGSVLLALFLRKASTDAKFRADMYAKFDAQGTAMAEQSRALAVIVQRVDDAGTTLAQVPGLKAATEVLKRRMDDHDSYAKETRLEILDEVRHRQ